MWIDALNQQFPDWQIYISNQLTEKEYAEGNVVTILYDERICRKYAEIFLSDLQEHCLEVKPAEVQKWSIFRRIRNWFIRLLGGAMG